MTDRELLERAAKAAGMETRLDQPRGATTGVMRARLPGNGDAFPVWSPLTDDGDALRLAVALRLEVDIHHTGIAVRTPHGVKVLVDADDEPDPYAATRRAIVRAAASLA